MIQSYYFDRDDVALPNISKWFCKQSDEEREHAQIFMKYQNTRGGRVVLQSVQKPEKDEWGSPLEAFQAALELEKYNNTSLLELHAVANQATDPQVREMRGSREVTMVIGWLNCRCATTWRTSS